MVVERTYTIPLRREFQKAPKYRRAKKAVNALKEFVQRHMKCDNVLVGPKLNLKIWENGIKNPPCRVKVNCVKDEKEDVTRVELFGFEFKKKEKKEKKAKPKGIAGKLQEKLGTKEEEGPKEAVTTKKDIKEVKKGVEVKTELPKAVVEEKAAPEKKEEPKEEVKADVPEEKAAEEKKEEAPQEKKE
ncbi:50S ribosomal protein L31e [Nanoarchaeota archaeon]